MIDPRESPSPVPFGRRREVETPEHVVLHYDLAGVGSRTAAALFDGCLIFVALFLLTLVTGALGLLSHGGVLVLVLVVILGYGVLWGYFALFEGFTNGRTPGKRALGIRVVQDDGRSIGFRAAASRGLLRIVDVQPGLTGLVGLLFIFFHPEHRRLGDLVAGTIVVRDRPDAAAAPRPEPAAEPPPTTAVTAPAARLTDQEYRVLSQFLERADDLAYEARRNLAERLVARVGERYDDLTTSEPIAFLHEVHEHERTARTVLAPGGAGGRPLSRGTRFAALGREKWETFRRDAATAEAGGFGSRTGEEVRRFAARYRDVAADLARARTYRVDPATIAMLERAVAAGHNVLYGSRRGTRIPLFELVFRTFPATVVRQRWYVLAAVLVFTAPAVAGFAMLREQPQLAYEVMPDVMLARVEAGRQEARAGRGYAQTPSPFLPLVATQIIANNVQVAFGAFAFGITAGIGTLVVLASNGLFFGASLGLFANYGLADWILTFVFGHGVLELTAIMIAGGAGFKIAHALIAPGDRSRRDALVLEGTPALLMVGAAASLLLLAGTIEGLLSESAAPPAFKLAVGASSVVLLILYVVQGVMVARREASF